MKIDNFKNVCWWNLINIGSVDVNFGVGVWVGDINLREMM